MNAIPPAEIVASNAASMKAAMSAMFGDEAGCPDEHDGEDSRTFTVTMGNASTQTVWTQRKTFAWGDLAAMVTNHRPGGKEGSCIVPAVFSGSSRKKEEAAQIDVAFLDSDSGMPLSEIKTAVEALGWEAVISSTHSHMTTRTRVKRSHWDRFFAGNPDADAADFLIQEKHYVAAVAAGAEPIESDNPDYVLIEHAPCPKYRVAVPLARSWVASDYPSQSAANAAWKERIEALAAALRLDHDQSCTDTSRLFYLPRRPPNGAAPETAIITGMHCDIFGLPAAPSPDDLFTGAPGKPGKPRQQTDGRPEYTDAITGEIIDLASWARGFGGRFLIAKALHARKPGVLTGVRADRVKIHIDCPNSDAHTEPGRDAATYVVNAGKSATKGFVVHCRHAHCTGLDRVSFVKQMLEQGWLSPDDLTDARFLLQAEPPPADDNGEPAGDWTETAPPPSDARDTGRERKRTEPEWPEPLDFIADAEMTGAPELRAEHLPEAIAPFVFDTAARMGVDPAAVALCALVSLASVIDDKWCIQPKHADDTWTEAPRLWGAIVGDPSMLKTPILKATTAPIDKMEAAARERHDNDMRRYKGEMKAWKDEGSDPAAEPKAPRLDRYLVEGTTIEALTEALRDDYKATQRAPSGKVLIRQDEMSEWVAGFDRYRSGGSGGADRGAYLRLFNGGRYTIDRVNRGTFAVPNWSACILGGIQPGPIRQIAKDAADDGLLQRFCYCVPARQVRGEDRRPDAAALTRYAALFPALAALHPGSGFEGEVHRVVLHAEAHEHRLAMLDLAEALAAMPDASDRHKSALGKWPGLWARMTLVFHLIGLADARARGEIGDVGNVARGAATTATRYMRDILLPHLMRAEAVMFSTVQTGHARWIAGFILSKGGSRIADRDLVQAYRPLRAPENRRERCEVMSSMEAMGWVRAELHPDGRQPVAWQINPKVSSVFAERAKRERAERHATKERIHETLKRHLPQGAR